MENTKTLNGIWHNQYGSEMKIEVDRSGRICGQYKTAVGRPETQDRWKENWFDLVGFLNEDMLSFVVNFNSTGAMCVVTGKLSKSQDRIETLTYTNYNLPQNENWKSVTAAAVIFERGPASKA